MLPRLPTFLVLLAVSALLGCKSTEPAAVQEPRVAQVAADRQDASEPATVAAATLEEKPKSAAEQFDLALERLSQGGQIGELSLPAEERDLVWTVVTALSNFRHSLADQGTMMTTRTAPLMALADELKTRAPLAIPTLVICRSATQFGVYDAYDPPRFIAGSDTPVIVYCELDNFQSKAASDGRWETKLTYEAVLYAAGDASTSVLSKKPTSIVDHCRNRRRDFFLADRMTIPSTLAVGKYLLKVTVIDQWANHVAEKSVPITVVPS